MISLQSNQVRNVVVFGFVVSMLACQKTGTIPTVPGTVSLTIVNAIPGSAPIIPVINTGTPLIYFGFASPIGYGNFKEYSPSGGEDTAYVVQRADTLDVNPKSNNLLFYNILDLKPENIYSLFLCGADTNAPDYLLTNDSIPYYGPSDSIVGIRFVNLSTGSAPMSINLEGSSNGSEVNDLTYKGVTGFKGYPCNSTVNRYEFVIRDATTGDSLTQFTFNKNKGYGLIDTKTNKLLTFKNVTIAIYGSESNGSAFPLKVMLIEDY